VSSDVFCFHTEAARFDSWLEHRTYIFVASHIHTLFSVSYFNLLFVDSVLALSTVGYVIRYNEMSSYCCYSCVLEERDCLIYLKTGIKQIVLQFTVYLI